MHSISSIDLLRDVDEVLRKSRSLAILDAILIPEWEHRYFSFNSKWNTAANEMMASMRNGAGDEYFLLFSPHGVVGKVLSTEEMAPDAELILEELPGCFSGFAEEPAFKLADLTFCLWRTRDDQSWTVSPRGRRSFPLLRFLTEDYSYYCAWAETYCERQVDPGVVKAIFQDHHVEAESVSSLNPNASIERLDRDLIEILGDD
jgi:hypothetical protein